MLLHFCLICCFRNILANLDLISRRTKRLSSSLETCWQAATSLIVDIKTQLAELTPARITVGSKPSPLLSFILLEAQTLFRQIGSASAFVDDLHQVLVGQSAATLSACNALKAIAAHRMPQVGIHNASSSHQDLSGWIRDLQQRLIKLPSADEDNCVFEISVFCCPESFLDATVRHLARQQFKSLHSVHLTADVVSNHTWCYCILLELYKT